VQQVDMTDRAFGIEGPLYPQRTLVADAGQRGASTARLQMQIDGRLPQSLLTVGLAVVLV
jgi:hypothetical protein